MFNCSILEVKSNKQSVIEKTYLLNLTFITYFVNFVKDFLCCL